MLRLLQPRNWWAVLVALFVIGLSGLALMGVTTYQDAPPIPDFVAPDGTVVVSKEEVLDGQTLFQRYALMTHGSVFGDGAARGPDYSADALHQLALAMAEQHLRAIEARGTAATEVERAGVREVVRQELKANAHDPTTNRVALTRAEARSFPQLVQHYARYFENADGSGFSPAGYVAEGDVRGLTAFFFWTAWVCAAQRPGSASSYTHNWPFDPVAGNVPGSSVTFWSVLGALALIVGLGGVLYLHGRTRGEATPRSGPAITTDTIAAFRPTETQRATYKFFALAGALFILQVLAGVLTVHDFVGFTKFFGVDVAELLPITVVRSWHVQLSLVWISSCWIGASVFVLPFLTGSEPRGQRWLLDVLFRALVVLVVGATLGMLLGPLGKLGGWWRALGHQGWEFVELGRVWQALLFAGFALWAVIVLRGAWSSIRGAQPFTLPNVLVASVLSILVFFATGFIAGPRTNFVIADFWRWCVIHMWAEAFFEVFTTVVVAWFMVLMGLTTKEAAVRVVYAATLLFLGSGLLGISHNFYWNAKPVVTLALGSVFSTLQVVPLVLLALEAWRFKDLPRRSLAASGGPRPPFGQSEAFLFLLGVNSWNFVGAGVFGFIINLPIINYYEHGTYLTVNHGHAALMGVYGNLSLAAAVFVARFVVAPGAWSAPLLRASFWSINLGLALMVALDLFPAGLHQFSATLENGLWYARSEAYVKGTTFQTLTWMRIVGGAVFTVGGVLPFAWFVVSRWWWLKDAAATTMTSATPLNGNGHGVVHEAGGLVAVIGGRSE